MVFGNKIVKDRDEPRILWDTACQVPKRLNSQSRSQNVQVAEQDKRLARMRIYMNTIGVAFSLLAAWAVLVPSGLSSGRKPMRRCTQKRGWKIQA